MQPRQSPSSPGRQRSTTRRGPEAQPTQSSQNRELMPQDHGAELSDIQSMQMRPPGVTQAQDSARQRENAQATLLMPPPPTPRKTLAPQPQALSDTVTNRRLPSQSAQQQARTRTPAPDPMARPERPMPPANASRRQASTSYQREWLDLQAAAAPSTPSSHRSSPEARQVSISPTEGQRPEPNPSRSLSRSVQHKQREATSDSRQYSVDRRGPDAERDPRVALAEAEELFALARSTQSALEEFSRLPEAPAKETTPGYVQHIAELEKLKTLYTYLDQLTAAQQPVEPKFPQSKLDSLVRKCRSMERLIQEHEEDLDSHLDRIDNQVTKDIIRGYKNHPQLSKSHASSSQVSIAGARGRGRSRKRYSSEISTEVDSMSEDIYQQAGPSNAHSGYSGAASEDGIESHTEKTPTKKQRAFHWTKEMDEILVSRRAEGYPFSAIAAHLTTHHDWPSDTGSCAKRWKHIDSKRNAATAGADSKFVMPEDDE